MTSINVFGYTRGRPYVFNNTVMTDQGTLFRGADMCLWNSTDTECWDKALYKMIADSGFNSIRLAVQFAEQYNGKKVPIDDIIPLIDKSIDAIESAGLYVGIDYHDCGHYDINHLTEFWTKVAPRYKDRTHVIYELANEPVAWAPLAYTAQNMIDQENIFKLMRGFAPNTIVIVLSYATADDNMLSVTDKIRGIDWQAAAVGFHPYHVGYITGIDHLHTKYPCINTEMTIPTNASDFTIVGPLNGDPWGWIKWHEQAQIAWWLWFVSVRGPQSLAPQLADARARGYMWKTDNFSAFVKPTIPIPKFILSPDTGSAPLKVDFDASGTTDDGTIASYSWDFGDGSAKATGVATSHTFTSIGNFMVRMTATDNNNNSSYCVSAVDVHYRDPLTARNVARASQSQSPGMRIAFDGIARRLVIGTGEEVRSILLHSVDGREIRSVKCPGTGPVEVDMKGIAVGTYIVTVQGAKGTVCKRIVAVSR